MLPLRFQLAGLGRQGEDYPGEFNSHAAEQAIYDIQGNVLDVIPPGSVLIPNNTTYPIEYRYEAGYGDLTTMPGIQSGRVPPGAMVAIQPSDVQPTGIISVVPVQNAVPATPDGIKTFPRSVDADRSATQTPAPTRSPAPLPAPSPAPAPTFPRVTTTGELVAPDNSGVSPQFPARSAEQPRSNIPAILAALAVLFSH